jgi:hypothetical protein
VDKRLAKRHKRQVERAKAKAKESEPDLRTPEQIEADRLASQSNAGFGAGGGKVSAPGAARHTGAGSNPGTVSSPRTGGS